MKKEKRKIWKKIKISIITLIISFFIVLTINCKKEADNIFIFKHAIMKIESASMEPNYKTNSLIIIKKTDFKQLKINDVIAFYCSALNNQLAFHRITKIVEDGVYTKGDNNNHPDNQLIKENDYIGKAILSYNQFAYIYPILLKTINMIKYMIIPVGCLSIFIIYAKSIKKTSKEDL